MAIFERITEGGHGSPYDHLAVHYFSAALGQLAEGKLTTQQVIAGFDLTANDQTEMAAIIAHYQGLGSAVEKVAYLWELERVFCLIESRMYSKAKALADLGL